MRPFAGLALAVALSSTPLAATTPDSFDDVAALVEKARIEWGAPGVSVAIASDGEIVWARGFGLADVENDVPARADTVYRIASISKPIAATAVMQLVESGKVSLDDPIAKYVPAFPHREFGPTLRHLMTHTSGIRHYRDGEMAMKEHFDSLEDAIAIFKDDLFLFAPAGMSETKLEHQGEIVPRRSRQYVKAGGNGRVKNAPFADLSIKWAGGGMISTVEDLIRFSIALDAGKLVARETLDAMYEPMTLADGSKTEYGLGWDTRRDERGRLWIAHGGGATGGSTYLLRLPEQKLAIAICANVEDAGDRRALAMAIAELVETPEPD